MCILGKALGNGFPITVILGKRDIMEAAQNSLLVALFGQKEVDMLLELEL